MLPASSKASWLLCGQFVHPGQQVSIRSYVPGLAVPLVATQSHVSRSYTLSQKKTVCSVQNLVHFNQQTDVSEDDKGD